MISNTYTAPSNGKIGAISISSERNLLGPAWFYQCFPTGMDSASDIFMRKLLTQN